MTDVSIIICVYTEDRWEDIREAVQSARDQEPSVAEIILVVDYNPRLKARAEAEFRDVLVIANTQAQGLSGARNSGIAAATGEFVAFLDDDAIADSRWVASLVEQCQKLEAAGAGSRVEPLWVGARPRWFPDEFLWTVGCSWRGLPSQVTEVRNITGGACCLRRDMFDKAGGFNPQLGRKKGKTPISCEETELCIRVRQTFEDAKFIFEPAAVIRHKVTAQRLTWSYFTLRCYAEGLSKAWLASLVGSRDGLSSERDYALRTLSAGVARGLADAVLRFDPGGLQRAAAITWGLACAAGGYLAGRIGMRKMDASGSAPLIASPAKAVAPEGVAEGIATPQAKASL